MIVLFLGLGAIGGLLTVKYFLREASRCAREQARAALSANAGVQTFQNVTGTQDDIQAV
jgi:hypothetical protein